MGRILFILLAFLSLPCSARKYKTSVSTVQRAEVSDADKRRLSYYFLEGSKQKLQGNYTAAYDLFQHCLDIDPTSPEALYEMAYMMYYLRQDSIGIEMFRMASDLDPLNPWYLETLAAAYMSDGDNENAIPVLERLSKIQTKRTDILLQLSELYKAEGNLKKSISALDRIEVLEGRTIPTSMQKYSLYQLQKKKKEAFAELLSLQAESPHDLRIPIILGREYLAFDEEQKALECYELVRRADPDNPQLQMAIIEYMQYKGEDSLYVAVRDSLIYSPGVDSDLRLTMMATIIEELEYAPDGKERTLQMLDSITTLFPTSETYSMRAAYFIQAKAGNDSIALALRDILKVDPSNQLAINRLLPFFIAQDDLENAIEICYIGINSYPEDLAYHYFLGASLYRLDRLDDAIEAFNNGICQVNDESQPNVVSDLYYVLGDCYHEKGDTAAAYEAYEKSLLCNEDNASCLNNYSYYLSLEGEQLEKAEKMAYRAIKLEPLNKTFLDTYAWVLFRSGNVSMAKFYIDRVIPPTADDETIIADEELPADVIQHAADIYRTNGLEEEAQRYERLAQEKKQ